MSTSPKMLNYSYVCYDSAILGNIEVLFCFSVSAVKRPSLSDPQVLPRHGEGVCLQLFLLAGAVSHLHHRHHTDQHLLSGLPGGLFLLHAVWRQRVDAAGQIHPATVGLAHRLHLLCDRHEEPAVCESPHSREFQII